MIEKLERAFNNLLRMLAQSELAKAEMVELWTIALAAFALIFALLAYVRIRRAVIDPGNVARLSGAIQELNLRLADFTGRWGTLHTNLSEEVKGLKEKVGRLEAQLRLVDSKREERSLSFEIEEALEQPHAEPVKKKV